MDLCLDLSSSSMRGLSCTFTHSLFPIRLMLMQQKPSFQEKTRFLLVSCTLFLHELRIEQDLRNPPDCGERRSAFPTNYGG